jgi:acetylornithine deacetylase/succinyl-diaminopimelate desuccinylase-like protein
MGHLDVVAAESEKWEHPPFAADIENGYIWGRGSLDCKNTVALWMMVMILLQRSGVHPKRDVIFLATADEEADHRHGIEWIVNNRFELIDAETALSEGGGFGITFMGKTFYTYQNAEKGTVWLRLTSKGTAGHASVPRQDNPTKTIAEIVHRLSQMSFPIRVTSPVRKMIDAMAATQKFPAGFLTRQLMNPLLSDLLLSRAVKDQSIAAGLHAMLHNTLCPTVLQAGSKVNVIPSEASCEIDMRILPGYDIDACIRSIRGIIGSGVDLQVIDARPPSESPCEHPLAFSIRKIVGKYQPDAVLIPFLLTGLSDACFLRPKGVVVYGFTPLLVQDDIGLAHGHNERISIESLEFGLKVGLEVVLDHILE